MIQIRPEGPDDGALIANVLFLAFGGEAEVQLVERIRSAPGFIPELSLVAVQDDLVIGHILLSPAHIQTKDSKVPVLALAPMAVLPDFQNQGVGSELVREALKRAAAMGQSMVVVVGHPEYYPRFGFVLARERGIELPFDAPDEAFLVCELASGSLAGIQGMVSYPPTFDALLY